MHIIKIIKIINKKEYIKANLMTSHIDIFYFLNIYQKH